MAFAFLGGNQALDFVGTLGARGTADDERLGALPDLADWIRQADIVDEFRAELTRRDLTAAIALRESLYAVITARIDGDAPPRRALAAVNAAAARPPATVHVTTGGRLRRSGDLSAVLSTVARAGLDLFGADRAAELKWCADDSCTHPFLDRSRGHRRRWCGMSGCGDRAKAAAYRKRQHTA